MCRPNLLDRQMGQEATQQLGRDTGPHPDVQYVTHGIKLFEIFVMLFTRI